LAGTDFVCQDQGSCNPRLMRSTIYTIPNANDLVKQSQIPLALAISPLANLRPDEVNIYIYIWFSFQSIFCLA